MVALVVVVVVVDSGDSVGVFVGSNVTGAPVGCKVRKTEKQSDQINTKEMKILWDALITRLYVLTSSVTGLVDGFEVGTSVTGESEGLFDGFEVGTSVTGLVDGFEVGTDVTGALVGCELKKTYTNEIKYL